MPANNQVTCWVVTDGKSGMENQCLGLAEALGLAPIIKRVKLRFPWRQLSPYLRLGLKMSAARQSDPIVPPWPRLVIATGRTSIPVSLYIREASRAAGTPAFTVQLQDPAIDPALFDLVVVPEHDRLRGANVITTRGALHRVTPGMLAREAQKFSHLAAPLPAPRIAVLIGGSNAVYALGNKEMVTLAGKLVHLAKITGGGLMVTPSRRTGEDNLKILQNALRAVPAYVWNGKGANPYYGMLGLADALVVTCDSVNMVSEACTTGKPVYVIKLPGGSPKFDRFHERLMRDGLAREFSGKLETWEYKPLDDVNMVARHILQELKA